MKKVAVVGGGASGLLSAILCAKEGLHVELFEQNSRCGKKILVSGNGRCNITNTSASIENYFSNNPSFVEHGLGVFGFKEFEKFMNGIGLLLDVKEDGRVYPLSNEAKSVVKIVEDYALSLGVKLYTDTKIEDVKELTKNYDTVIVATGSRAASHLGGNSDGEKFAKLFGHNIIPAYPSLVQLHVNDKLVHKMSGAKVNGSATLLINRQKDITCKGDILFTNYGVSGFAILDISQKASVALMEYNHVSISLNLLPNFTMQKLAAHITKLSVTMPDLSVLDILAGLIPLKMATAILEHLTLVKELQAKEIHPKLAKKIAHTLTDLRFDVEETHGFRHAEVSGGGIDTMEINPKTMESLKHKNLYFCGEVLDVVGARGGYNFAWAWASAYLAAKDITLNR